MASVTIRNLSDEVKAKLAARAKASGESLENYLRRLLAVEADRGGEAAALAQRFRDVIDRFQEVDRPAAGEDDFTDCIAELRARDRYSLHR